MMQKRNNPLTEQELKSLSEIRHKDMCAAFPNHSRRFLEQERERYQERNPEKPKVSETVNTQDEIEKHRLRRELGLMQHKYAMALDELEGLKNEDNFRKELPNPEPITIKTTGKGKKHEATAVIIASDWHCEEEVKSETVNELNQYNLNIFNDRVGSFFENAVKLYKKERNAIHIDKMLLGFLGDMMTGNIHPELLETGLLGPMDAAKLVQDTMIGGIEFVLDRLDDVQLIVPIKDGNHARITAKPRVATAQANSIEWFIAQNVRDYFKNNDRVNVVCSRSYHTYVNVYNKVIRLHHGDAIRYQGGVGGITIPVNKAISEWNKGKRADLDVFGHWHQLLFGRDFISCGSMIGFSPYALKIKAAYERPQQAFFLVDSEFGVTMRAPILLEPVG